MDLEDKMKKSLGSKTLLYPTPVWVIGTYDFERGHTLE